MDWNQLRHDWQDAAPAAPMMAVDELRRRDRSLWTKVRRRDLLETVAAVAVVVWFGLMAIVALVEGAWLQAAFTLLVVAWGAVLPFGLRRSRRLARDGDHGVSMLAYLQAQREAALAQARMLERVWLWYLAPPAIGITGLTLARDGFTPGALGYLAVLVLLYAGIAWLNRHAARTQFRAHADELQRQIDALGDQHA